MNDCANCHAPLHGHYCSECGQRATDLKVSFWHLVKDALEEAFEFDSRIGRTIVPLFFRPGFLAREWTAGRRVRYSSPLRIYLFASFAFFLVMQLRPADSLKFVHFDEGTPHDRQEASAELEKLTSQASGIKKKFLQKINDLLAAEPSSASRIVRDGVVSQMPKVVFVLMPIFALILTLLFRKTDAFYVDHLILTLHLHAFVFLIGIIDLLKKSQVIDVFIGLVIAAYSLVALHTFYRESWPRVIGKWVALSLLYLVPLTLGLIAAVLVAIYTT